MIRTIVTTVCLFLLAMSVRAVEHLKLSTTTSTDNSGLLAVLHPVFETKYDAKIDVIAVGTGKALKIGANGDVDVVFVHAPDAELKYVEQGDFIDRKAVMHNDFVIVGSQQDPAKVAAASSATDALQRIAKYKSDFVSRGDDSGTHKKEKALWAKANIQPESRWYIQAGQGMGAVLKIADKMSLKVLYEGDETLFNPYHVMAVNPQKHAHVNYDLAKKYIDFVTSKEGQTIINNFRKSDQQLFYSDAVK
ncbi:MAG: substrate-binding domain-containing protein [Gammaproteobacteria bacterium]|nr:substrate-binding domain-containing protein [Gammaproteobacteria bacterium]